MQQVHLGDFPSGRPGVLLARAGMPDLPGEPQGEVRDGEDMLAQVPEGSLSGPNGVARERDGFQ